MALLLIQRRRIQIRFLNLLTEDGEWGLHIPTATLGPDPRRPHQEGPNIRTEERRLAKLSLEVALILSFRASKPDQDDDGEAVPTG